MDIKEELTNNVIMSLSSSLNTEVLSMVKNCLCVILSKYCITTSAELPSINVVDYQKAVSHFLIAKRMAGISPKSIETYRGHLNRFFEHEINQCALSDITTNQIRGYLATVSTRCSMSYTNDVRVVLNVFFQFCEDEEYIQKNPVRRIPRIKQKKVIENPFTDMEIEKIKNACQTPREHALVALLMSTGARRSEIIKIKVSDVDFAERSILLHGKGNKDRIVYFSARTELVLKDYISNRKYDSIYLFAPDIKHNGKMLGVSTLRDMIVKIGMRAGVSHCHLHRFRKWFATHMINCGVQITDLKEMMGHTNISTTNTHYIEANMERVKLAHKQNAA